MIEVPLLLLQGVLVFEVIVCRLGVYVPAHKDGSVGICIPGKIHVCEAGWFRIIDMVCGGGMGKDRWAGSGMTRLLWGMVCQGIDKCILSPVLLPMPHGHIYTWGIHLQIYASF